MDFAGSGALWRKCFDQADRDGAVIFKVGLCRRLRILGDHERPRRNGAERLGEIEILEDSRLLTVPLWYRSDDRLPGFCFWQRRGGRFRSAWQKQAAQEQRTTSDRELAAHRTPNKKLHEGH